MTALPDVSVSVSCSGSDNIPTVPWSTKEALTINPVVADFLRIRMLHSRQFFVNLSIFYHPGIKYCTADDASCLFGIYDTSLLAHMSAACPHPHSLWKISLPSPDIISCIISTLCRNPCEQELHKILYRRISTSSGATSAPLS